MKKEKGEKSRNAILISGLDTWQRGIGSQIWFLEPKGKRLWSDVRKLFVRVDFPRINGVG